jgi:uncharacterized iron-regulated membrane protein
MRTIHRVITLFVVIVTVYLSVTGTLIQLVDLRTLFSHAPASEPNMAAIREGINGPGSFQVISYADYTAEALPANLSLDSAMGKTLQSARGVEGSAPFEYVEARMADGKAVTQFKAGRQMLRFDAVTGEQLPNPVMGPPESQSPDSLRNDVKHLHRMTEFGGDWTLWINVFVGIALAALVVTGLVMYFQLLGARTRMKKPSPFWVAGGWWRTLHRAIALTSSVFVLVVAFSGLWLAVESLVFGVRMTASRPVPGAPRPPRPPTPTVTDADVPGMLSTALTAYKTQMGNVPVRAVRLRTYEGMPQGVIITGEEQARQLVFNAMTGKRTNPSELGFHATGFPFGWQAHQYAKEIHRGDFIGLSGRWMDLYAGLSILYLSISGAVMYFEMWGKRKRVGHSGLIWK